MILKQTHHIINIRIAKIISKMFKKKLQTGIPRCFFMENVSCYCP